MSEMHQAFDRHIFRALLGLVAITLGIGTVVYHLVEHMSWLDAYYLSVVTLTTVGYGDFSPQTTFGKVFTTFYIFAGVGILTTYIAYSMRRFLNRIQPQGQHADDD
jgi:voltage-gated potassium channel